MSFIDFGPTGTCRRRDAVAAFGEHQIRSALVTGEAHSPWSGVLVDPARAGDPLTVIAAARLAVSELAVVTGPSAAYLHGLSAVSPTPVHLVLPYESRKQRRSGIVIHNGTSLDDDREERRGLPVLNLERIVGDLACTLPPWQALAVLDEAFAAVEDVNRPAFRRRLQERLQDRPDPRGTRIGRRLVDIATGRAESVPESWLMWRVVDLGFPVPESNLPVLDIDGHELYRLDLGWREVKIGVEYNGYAAHIGREAEDDARRDDLKRRGWITVDVDDAEELFRGDRLEKELCEAFARRGIDLTGRIANALRPRPHRQPRSRSDRARSR